MKIIFYTGEVSIQIPKPRILFPEIYRGRTLAPHLQSEAFKEKLLQLIGDDIHVVTNSDHIINAMRVWVRCGYFSCCDIEILHFDEGEIESLFIEPTGKIKRPPVTFFNQMDKDLDIILGLNQNVPTKEQFFKQ